MMTGMWLTGVALNVLSRGVFRSCVIAHESLAAVVHCSASSSCVKLHNVKCLVYDWLCDVCCILASF